MDSDAQSQSAPEKIDLLLKATGDAPIMIRKKWSVNPDQTVGWVITFIRQYLKLPAEDSLVSLISVSVPAHTCSQFLYVNQAFAPAPDQVIRNLHQCFGSDGKLVLHYAKSPAWG